TVALPMVPSVWRVAVSVSPLSASVSLASSPHGAVAGTVNGVSSRVTYCPETTGGFVAQPASGSLLATGAEPTAIEIVPSPDVASGSLWTVNVKLSAPSYPV